MRYAERYVMIETQLRTGSGSPSPSKSSPSKSGIGPSSRLKERAADTPAASTKAAQGPGFATYLVAPATLVAAQETRGAAAFRRDDAQNGAQNSRSANISTNTTPDAETHTEGQRQPAATLAARPAANGIGGARRQVPLYFEGNDANTNTGDGVAASAQAARAYRNRGAEVLTGQTQNVVYDDSAGPRFSIII